MIICLWTKPSKTAIQATHARAITSHRFVLMYLCYHSLNSMLRLANHYCTSSPTWRGYGSYRWLYYAHVTSVRLVPPLTCANWPRRFGNVDRGDSSSRMKLTLVREKRFTIEMKLFSCACKLFLVIHQSFNKKTYLVIAMLLLLRMLVLFLRLLSGVNENHHWFKKIHRQ